MEIRRNGVSGKETGRIWLVSGTDLIKSPFQPHNAFLQEGNEIEMWLLILFFYPFSFSLPAVNEDKVAFKRKCFLMEFSPVSLKIGYAKIYI